MKTKMLLKSSVALAAHMAVRPEALIGAPRMDGAGKVAALLVEVKSELTRVGDETRRVAENALAQSKKTGDVTDEVKQASDKLLTEFHQLSGAQQKLEGKLEALETRNLDLEQQVAGQSGNGPGTRQTAGQEIAADERLLAYVEGGMQGSITLRPANAITSVDGSGGGLIWPDNEQAPIGMPRRQLLIRQLLNVTTTGSDVIKYVKQTLRTNAAAPVAEEGTMPASSFGWTKAETNVRKIAHVTHISDEAMADSGQLQGMIDGEMRYGLDLTEETQILSGDGLGENLTGLVTGATAFVAAAGLPNTTRIDRLRLGLLQVALANYSANGITIHPTDWAGIELLKDTVGRYIFGDPNMQKTPMLWGLDTIATLSHSVGEWMVGNFFMAATLYDRQEAEILISSEHGTNFIDGMKTMRGQKRIALANKLPAALVTGNFTFI